MMDQMDLLMGTIWSGADNSQILFNSTSVVATNAVISGTTNCRDEIKLIVTTIILHRGKL